MYDLNKIGLMVLKFEIKSLADTTKLCLQEGNVFDHIDVFANQYWCKAYACVIMQNSKYKCRYGKTSRCLFLLPTGECTFLLLPKVYFALKISMLWYSEIGDVTPMIADSCSIENASIL